MDEVTPLDTPQPLRCHVGALPLQHKGYFPSCCSFCTEILTGPTQQCRGQEGAGCGSPGTLRFPSPPSFFPTQL